MDEIIRWIRSDGAAYPLTNQSDIEVLFNREGFFMPPISYVEEEPVETTSSCSDVSTQQGRVVRRLNIDPREIQMELLVKGTDRASLRGNIRKYMRAFSPLFGEGKLEVTSPDGVVRLLNCRYLEGLTIQESPDQTTRTTQRMKVVLIAYDPYWYADTSTTLTLTQQESSVATFFPFFPLTLSHYGSFAEANINNDGDIMTYPVWTVYGPVESVQIENLSTGEKIIVFDPDAESGSVNLLDPGQYLTIDCRPGNLRVERSDGTNLFEHVSTDSSFFGFQPGESKIRIEAAGASDETKVEISFTKRYLVV